MKKYHKKNFYKHTFCRFVKSEKNFDRIPDFKSSYNSEYFFEDDGVYRRSNHWGRAGNCRWILINNQEKSQAMVTGFALWTDFFENNERDELFYIIEKEPSVFEYYHRDEPLFNSKQDILRTAKETAQRIKSLREITSDAKWIYYLDKDIERAKKWFIKMLIYSNKNLTELKNEYLQKE